MPYKQVEQVLIYILLSYPERVDKDVLSELVWPDRPPGTSRRNLRHAVFTLRSIPGLKDIIISGKNQLSLESPEKIDCDYINFLKLIDPGSCYGAINSDRIRMVLDIYGSGLLESFGAEPSAEFGFWLHNKKRICANSLYKFLFASIPYLCDTHEIPLLANLAERLTLWDPYDTSLYEFILRSLIARKMSSDAGKIHWRVVLTAEKSGDSEALNGLAEINRRIFPAERYPVRKKLPASILPFIGRKAELGSIEAIIRRPEARLISIVAPGGYGKTSFILALAKIIDVILFPDGIYFIPLRECSDETSFLKLLIDALELRIEDEEYYKSLTRYLYDKQLLLIFDECETKGFVKAYIEKLLNAASYIKIICTSRKQIELIFEWVYVLPPFTESAESVELFFSTAERKTGRTVWSDHEKERTVSICNALNGIPLAIEMAASRIGSYDVDTISKGLSGNADFNFFSPGNRIESIIEYQTGLLDNGKQRSLRMLSLFHDCFDRKSAEQAFSISPDTFNEYCMLSLVWPVENGRFRLHSLVRSYLRAQLHANGNYDKEIENLSQYLANACHQHFLRLFSLKEDPLSVIEWYPDETIEAYIYALRERRWDMALKIAIPLGSYLHYFGHARSGETMFNNELENLLQTDFWDSTANKLHFILQLSLICAVLALQSGKFDSGKSIIIKMRELDEQAGCRFLAEQDGETDLYRLYLAIAFPWVEGLYAMNDGNKERAEELFLVSHNKAVKYSAHLCRVYVVTHLALIEFDRNPEKGVALLQDVLKTGHGRNIDNFRNDIYLNLARFYMVLGQTEASELYAGFVLQSPDTRTGSRTEMEALFMLSILRAGEDNDREISQTYLMKALESARKNNLYASAFDYSMQYLRNYISVYREIPGWEVYENISLLVTDPGTKKSKAELDRLFGLI